MLAACPRAEELRTDAVRELEDLAQRARPLEGPWFPPEPTALRIRELAAEIRGDESRLQDDYRFGVTRW